MVAKAVKKTIRMRRSMAETERERKTKREGEKREGEKREGEKREGEKEEKREGEKERRVKSETLLASPTELDLPSPLRLQDLTGRDTTGRVGIEDGVDDIATPSLLHSTQPSAHESVNLYEASQKEEKGKSQKKHTRCNVSIGP